MTYHIPSLDGIRAGSFFIVYASHAGLGDIVFGDVGVTIFFFLSGFLITTLMRAEFERTGAVNLGYFWLRRALRILPPLYVVMLAAMLLARLLYPPGRISGGALASTLLFYANYWGIDKPGQEVPGTGAMWSLAVEEHFYLLFPLLYLAMQKSRMPRHAQAQLLWGLCALVLVWRHLLVLGLHATSSRIYLGTDTRVDSILFGCALGVWNNPVLDEPRQPAGRWNYLLLPALAAFLISLVWRERGEVFAETWYFTIQGIALTPIFVCAMRYPSWPAFRALNYRAVAFIGVLSYSLYLVHDVLLRGAAQLWPRSHMWQRGLTALAASIIAAWAIYAVIERPCARLRKQFTSR